MINEDLLSQWEAEAKDEAERWGKNSIDDWGAHYTERILADRILSLIDLIRKKDEALKISNKYYASMCGGSGDCGLCDSHGVQFEEAYSAVSDALALTEQLK